MFLSPDLTADTTTTVKQETAYSLCLSHHHHHHLPIDHLFPCSMSSSSFIFQKNINVKSMTKQQKKSVLISVSAYLILRSVRFCCMCVLCVWGVLGVDIRWGRVLYVCVATTDTMMKRLKVGACKGWAFHVFVFFSVFFPFLHFPGRWSSAPLWFTNVSVNCLFCEVFVCVLPIGCRRRGDGDLMRGREGCVEGARDC